MNQIKNKKENIPIKQPASSELSAQSEMPSHRADPETQPPSLHCSSFTLHSTIGVIKPKMRTYNFTISWIIRVETTMARVIGLDFVTLSFRSFFCIT